MRYTTIHRISPPDMMMRCVGGLALAAMLALSGAGCHQASQAAPPALTTVQVAAAEDAAQALDSTTDDLRYTGNVTADTQVDLSFKQGGYIEEILQVAGEDGRLRWIQQGDPVRQGQTLARVRPGDYSTRVAAAQAQQSQAQAQQSQAQSGLAQAQSGLAQAQAGLLQARAAADQAAAGLREAQAGEEASVAALTNARTAITLAEKQTEAAHIGRQTAEAQRNEARAAFTKTRQDFDRAESLYKAQSLTRTDYDAARAAYDVAEARLRQAEEGIAAADNRILQAEQQEQQAHGQEKQAVAQVTARRSQVRQAGARVDASLGAVQGAEAQVETARAEISGAAARVETARAGVTGAAAQVSGAEIPLEETCLKAPLDGVLIKRAVEVGSLVGPSAPPAFTIADTSKVKILFGVPDSEVKALQLGRRVPVRVDVLGPTPFTGHITAISPAADPRTRVFNVEVTVPNRNRRLKVGMIATLDLTTKRDHAAGVAVPLTALLRRSVSEGGAAVLVVAREAGHEVARLRPVELGSVYGNRAVVKGIHSGEQVITEGTNQVRDGETVQVAGKPMEDNNVAQD
jgi:multidrug efflux system membrane fusion protein